MDINNLIMMCGLDNVKIQTLDSVFIKFDAANSRNPARFQFGTEADCYPIVGRGQVRLAGSEQAIILWLPRAKVQDAVAGDDAPEDPKLNAEFQDALAVQLSIGRAIAKASLKGEEVEAAQKLLALLNARIDSHEPI